MNELVLDLPAMYADHHVLRVREVLLGLGGVDAVWASAALRKVKVAYQDGRLSEDALRESLTQAGYPPDQAAAIGEFPKRHEDAAPWYTVLDRRTTTERKDREMAGDFRRY